MTKYHSMLFREFRINRKHYITGLFTLLLIFCFIFFSLICASQNIQDATVLTQSFAMMIAVFPLVCFGEDMVFKTDLDTGWLDYSYTLPITAFDRAVVELSKFCIVKFFYMLLGLAGCVGILQITNSRLEIGYVVLQFIFLNYLLLLKIIVGFFVLKARTADRYKKLSDLAHLVWMSVAIFLSYIILKCVGFDFKALLTDNNKEPFSFNIIPELSGKLLLLLIPLALILGGLYFAAIYKRLENAYSGNRKEKSTPVKSEQAVNLTAPHKGPVGFLYKELRQNMKSILGVIIIPFAVLILSVVCLSIVSLDKDFGGDGWLIKTLASDVIRIVSVVLGYLFVDGLLLSVFRGDDKKLWAYFTVSVPNGVNKFLLTKYALSFAMCGLFFLSSYAVEMLIATINRFSGGGEIMSITVILTVFSFLLLFQNSFSIPLMLRFGEKKGVAINLSIILGLATTAVLTIVLLPEEVQYKVFKGIADFITSDAIDLKVLLPRIFAVISIGAYLLSYKVSHKLFMKGINEYDQ